MAAARAIPPAQSSTTTIFTLPTTTCIRDDLLAQAIRDIVPQMADTPAPVILLNQCLILPPSRPTTMLVDTIVRTMARFRRRGHTIPPPLSPMRLTTQT